MIVVTFSLMTLLLQIVSSEKSSLTIRRILSEWRDFVNNSLTLSNPFNTSSVDDIEIRLSPMDNDILQWHFSFTGPENSSYHGGCYHGKITLSPDYPRKAPSICLLTPNGRWEAGKDICLSGKKT